MNHGVASAIIWSLVPTVPPSARALGADVRPPRRARAGVVAVLVAAGLLAAACGTTDDGPVSAGPTTTEAPTTTTSLPPGGRQPTPEDPLRVVFAGDSLMSNLAPATTQALNEGGAAQAEFVLSPSIARDPTVQVLWQAALEQTDPDVIVMLVGTWENAVELGRPGDAGWREQYEANVLDPFVQLLTGQGAHLIWIGMPAVDDPDRTWEYGYLNQVYAALPDRYPGQVSYIDGGAAVSAPEGGYAETVALPDGGELRLRRLDGTHLCPDGVVLIARPVLDQIVQDWNVPLLPTWESASWRLPENVVKPEECPGLV